MSSDSSSEDSGSGEADTVRTIYKGLAEVVPWYEDERFAEEYDPDYAFRLNDAKLDAAAIACFALRFVTRETDGDARLEEAVDKAGCLRGKFLSQLERAGEGRKRKRQSLHESLKEALERERAKAAR